MTNDVHVMPVGDLVEHDTTDDCLCGPTAEPVTRDDGSVGWLIVHHSLDGREAPRMTRGGVCHRNGDIRHHPWLNTPAGPKPGGCFCAVQPRPRHHRPSID